MSPTPERRATDPWRAEMQAKIEKQEQDLAVIRTELAENTSITRELRDIMVTIKSGAKFFDWIGKGLKWLSGMAAAGWALWELISRHTPR